MFLPKNQKNIEISTGNKEAEVYVNNLQEGKGSKVTLAKTKREGLKQVTVRVPMHKDASYVMAPSKRIPGYWVTMPLDVATIPLVYGAYFSLIKMPKYFSYEKKYVYKNEHKIPVKSEQQKNIRYIATKLAIKDINKDLNDYQIAYSKNYVADFKKAEQKKIELTAKQKKQMAKEAGKNKLEEEKKEVEYDDSYFSKDIYETLKKGGFVDTTGSILVNRDNILGLESTIVGGASYKAYSGYAATSTSSNLLMIKLDIDWKVRNQYNELVDSFRISEYSDQFRLPRYGKESSEIFEKALSDAVNNSFLALYKNKNFLKHLEISNEKEVVLETIKMNKPTKVVTSTKDALKAAVIIKHKDNKGHGSGFAITNDGYILTNYHVISGERAGNYKQFVVVLPNGKEVEAKVVRVNPSNDLALLKIEEQLEMAFLLSEEKVFDILDEVYAVGAPASVDLGNTVTLGILSNERIGDGVDKLQLNISVSPGNSGGPVFLRENAALIGVISSKLAGKNMEGVAFAIPAHNVHKYLSISY